MSISEIILEFDAVSTDAVDEIAFSIQKTRRQKQLMNISANAVAMNTKSKKQTYATALIEVIELVFYYLTFSIDLTRLKSDQVTNCLHRDVLLVELCY